MRLIEKKCPNCGADLEFDENAKSCKCSYCKRSFEIERDLNDIEKFNLVYNTIHRPMKLIVLIPVLVVFAFIILVNVLVFTNVGSHKSYDSFTTDDDNEEIIENTNPLITDVSEFTNDNLDTIDHNCYSIVHQSVVGRSDTTYSYQITGDPRLEKLYVAYTEDSNYVISIYKVIYHNFFNQSDQQTVYIPVVFENVTKQVSFSLANGKNPAPEYYLNDDYSSYIYAYSSFDDAYNNVLKPLEENYTITEK